MTEAMLDLSRRFLISPPFGNYLSHGSAYSVMGSYTVERRPGRAVQVLRSVRPLGRDENGNPKGWLNKIGLRNPGMSTLPKRQSNNKIISLAPLKATDWHAIERWMDERFGRVIVEINLSCPNVSEHPDLPADAILRRMGAGGAVIIWKLAPASTASDTVSRLFDCGQSIFHLSNTYPTPAGGLSGPVLRDFSLPIVYSAARRLPQAEIIGGGGIYTLADLKPYRDAGATRFSMSSAWFWPQRALRVMRVFR